MKKIITLLFCTLLTCSSVITAQEPAAISALQDLLKPITTIKSAFNQTVYSEKNKVLQKSSGSMEFKRPNLFRWQIDLPESSLVVTDGKKLWNYDADLEQVTVQAFTASNEISPISFLFDDVEQLNKDFTIVIITAKGSPCVAQAQQCFKLTPKQENANFSSVEIGFTQGQIKVLRLLDHLGQTSVFDFNQVQNNPKIANARFTFTPPAGVDVISNL